jgi:hypothetical protein
MSKTTPINISGTITTGNVAQVLSAEKQVPRKIALRNTSGGNLYISTTGTASASSMPIKADEYYESPYSTSNAISIFGATTGQSFFAEEGAWE